MRYVSTAGQSPPVSLREALLAGPAPDGGLYLPERLEPLPENTLRRLHGQSLADTAVAVLGHVIGGNLPPDLLREVIESGLDFPMPAVSVENRIWCLELFHGPTLAFKDVGARFMARLMGHYLQDEETELTILVATSGDTGSAIAHAFHRQAGVRVVVLFPRGRVSPRQQKQFTTLGGNIRALAVDGVFDDCQRLVKQAFADVDLRKRRPIASANSINICRLLPQMVYYFHGVAQLPLDATPLIICTPSGNFGNLTAGLMARRLGLPVSRFVAATNANDVVPAYLASGRFLPRPSRSTLSSAMDVGDPSNFARMLALYAHDLLALQEDVFGSAHTDEATRVAIGDLHARTGIVLDPHSAVGYLGLQAGLRVADPRASGLFLATAHPAKFAEVVEPATGQAVPVPDRLAACLGRPEQVSEIPADYAALRAEIES